MKGEEVDEGKGERRENISSSHLPHISLKHTTVYSYYDLMFRKPLGLHVNRVLTPTSRCLSMWLQFTK